MKSWCVTIQMKVTEQLLPEATRAHYVVKGGSNF